MKTFGISHRVRLCVCLAAAVVASDSLVFAAPITPSNWPRPTTAAQASSDLTSYQTWDVFTSTIGPNTPGAGSVNTNGTANAYDSGQPGSGGFLTGGGNIYSFSGVILPRSIVPSFNLGAGYELAMLVQVTSQGSLINTSALTVNGVPASALPDYSYTEISSTPLGGFGGAKVEHAWTFALAGDPASVQLDWGWGPTSASLDIVSVDTHAQAVPEPTTAALSLLGALGCAGVYGRRQRSHRAPRSAGSLAMSS